MASWPPPPPPPPRPGGPHNNQGHEGTHNGQGNAMNQTEPQFSAPPPRHRNGGAPTESFPAMRLNGSSLPPPPARTMQGSTFPHPPRPTGSALNQPLAQSPHMPRSAHMPPPPAVNSRSGAATASTTRGQASFPPPPPPPPLQPPHRATASPASLHAPPGRSVPSPVMSGPPPMSAPSAHYHAAGPPPPVYGASPPTTSSTTDSMSAPHAGPPPPVYGASPPATATTTSAMSAPHAGPPPPAYGAGGPPTSAIQPPPPPPMHHQHQSSPVYPMTTRPPPPSPAMTSRPQPMMNGPPQQQQPKPKVDPSQIPRPPLFTRPQNGEAVPIYYTKRMLNGLPPPDADSRFISCDDGNAAPQLIRSSLYKIPQDRGVWKKTGLPELGLICTPLAMPSGDYTVRPRVMPMNETEETYIDPQRIPVDYSTLSNNLPPRCSRCQAYANPFWLNGNKCNFCGTRNRSISNNMSLQYGTIEYVVGGPYVTRKRPVEPIFLYAIDATSPNVMGYVPLLGKVGVSLGEHARRQTVKYANPPRIGVALVGGFGVVVISGDGRVHVMSDVSEEPFCPLPVEEWTHDVSTDEGLQQWVGFSSRLLDYWQPFLDSLDNPSAYGQTSYALSCGGAALAFMADALADSGGRGTLLSWRRPNFGLGAIKDRETHNMTLYTREAMERRLYMPLQLQPEKESGDAQTAQFYRKLGETCVKNRVTLDIMMQTLISPSSYLDIGTLSELCRVTSGKFKWIRARDWQEPILEELRRPVMSFSGSDAVFKVRCSEGMRIKSFVYGCAGVTVDNVMSDSPEQELSAVMPDTSFAVKLEHRIGGLPQNTQMVYFQAALLHTTSSGQRRVRVSTLGVQASANVADVFRSVDFTTTMALVVRESVAYVWHPSDETALHFKTTRNEIMKRCVDILSCYRRNTTANAAPPGQLILPDRLQLLPLFCMSVLKSAMFRSSLPKSGSGVRATHPSPTGDERSFALFYGASISPATSMLIVHPNVFSLLNLEDGAGEWESPDSSRVRSDMEMAACHRYVQLPPSTHPSIASLDEDGVYLIDDGFTIYIYFGKDCSTAVKSELLEMNESGCSLSTQTEFGQQIHRLAWQMRTFAAVGPGSESDMRPTYPPVVVVLADDSHRDPFEELIMNSLVDDPTSSEHDYVEFLCDLHKHVRKQVETGIGYGQG